MKRTNVAGLGAMAAVVALAACEPGPYDPNDPNRNRNQGALAGAIIGGVAGAAAGDGRSRVDEAVGGAIVGGLVGGAIGNRLDKQAAELTRDMDNRVDVINTGDELIVRMPQDILFDIDSAAIRSGLRADLFTLADSLQRYPDSTVLVEGHTDNTGSAAYNQALSERRAGSVVRVLINAGVAQRRLRAVGRGESEPIATNQTPEGRQLNRRVDITIRPN